MREMQKLCIMQSRMSYPAIRRNELIPMNHPDPRRRYILAAAQLIKELGEENVSARKIAAVLGTAPSAIYRHFQTLDELMAYAAISYRYDTYAEMDRIAVDASNAFEMYEKTEREFARFAFARPKLLDCLVFGAYSQNMSELMANYRMIFPEAVDEKKLYSAAVLNGQDFEKGNMRLLQMCRDDGSLQADDATAHALNGVLVHMFKGFLKTALDHPEMEVETLVSRYMNCFIFVLQPYARKNTNYIQQ